MSRSRHFLHVLRAATLFAGGAMWWAKRQLSRNRCIIVLAFHRVLDDSELRRTHSLDGIVMRRRTFDRLVSYVVRHYQTVDLSRSTPGGAGRGLRIAFTFDDGWADTYAGALPVACAYGIPMTMFICPGLLGVPDPFWPERVAGVMKASRPGVRASDIEQVIERMKSYTPQQRAQAMAGIWATTRPTFEEDSPDRTLTWGQIDEMARAGVAIGGHTQTHQILTTLPECAARTEIGETKTSIERVLNCECRLFAYPNGDHAPAIRNLVAEAGFKLAFTTKRGPWTEDCDPLTIPRMNLYEGNVTGPTRRFSALMFEYAVFWSAWRGTRGGDRD